MLYHGSQFKHLKKISPKPTLSNDTYIGDYVFATTDKALAAMYLVPKGFATLMHAESKAPILVICGDEKNVKRLDKGGVIYTLPSDTFTNTPQEGLEMYEKVSQEPVTPIDFEIYESIFDAFDEYKITVKFVDEQIFETLVSSKDQKRLIESL